MLNLLTAFLREYVFWHRKLGLLSNGWQERETEGQKGQGTILAFLDLVGWSRKESEEFLLVTPSFLPDWFRRDYILNTHTIPLQFGAPEPCLPFLELCDLAFASLSFPCLSPLWGNKPPHPVPLTKLNALCILGMWWMLAGSRESKVWNQEVLRWKFILVRKF